MVEAYSLAFDPVEDGFAGVLVELYAIADGYHPGYEVRQTATGNRLLVFRSEREGLARAVFDGGGGIRVESAGSSCGAWGIE